MNRRVWIKIIIIFAVALTAILSIVAVGCIKVSSVNVNMIYPSNQVIIEKNDIVKRLNNQFGDFTKYARNQIDKKQIKNFILKDRFVQKAIINLSVTGELRINVVQRQAIARVYQGSKSYYLTLDKQKIEALNDNEIAMCPIVIGKISEAILFDIASKICNNDVLRENISSIIYINKTLRLTPREGDYIILLGKQEDWDIELEKLAALTKYAFMREGWDDYKQIDLRYHNQVICVKHTKDTVLVTNNK